MLQHTYGWPDNQLVFHSSPNRIKAEEAWRAADDILERMLDGEIEYDQMILNRYYEQAEALEVNNA